MLTKNTETTYTTICFSIINLLFLAQHYSSYGCICAFVAIAYYFYRVNYIENKNNANKRLGISNWLGTYLGVFALDAIAILGFEQNVFETELYLSLNVGALFGVIALSVVEIIILSKISENATISGNRFFYLRYIILALATIGISSIYIKWESSAIISFVTTIIIIAVLVDSINKKVEIKPNNKGFVWASILLIVFNVLALLYGDFAILVVDKIHNFKLYDSRPWYIYLIVCILLMICAIRAHLLSEIKQSTANDERIYIGLIATIVMLWVLRNVSTKYDMVFILLMIGANFIFLYQTHNDKYLDVFDLEISELTLKYVSILALIILLPVSLYNGFIIQFICLSIGVIGVYAFYLTHAVRDDKEAIQPHKTWKFWQFLLTVVAAYAVVTAYFKSNFSGNYFVIGILYIITTIAFAMIYYENKLNHINHSTMRIVIAVAAILFFVFSSNQSNVSIKFNVDNKLSEAMQISEEKVDETGKIKIEVKTKDNRKLKAYCYWDGSSETITQLPLEESNTNYIDINNGCLKVVCQDENGVVSSASHWFLPGQPVETEPVGVRKMILRTPEMMDEEESTEESTDESTDESTE